MPLYGSEFVHPPQQDKEETLKSLAERLFLKDLGQLAVARAR